jgi:hypothetical protein
MDTMYDPEHACLSVHIKQVGFNTTCFENNLRTIYTRTGKRVSDFETNEITLSRTWTG